MFFPDFRANRIRKSGLCGTIGFLTSSPFRGCKKQLSKCPGSTTTEAKGKTGFPGFPAEPDPENRIYGHRWNPQFKPDLGVPLPRL